MARYMARATEIFREYFHDYSLIISLCGQVSMKFPSLELNLANQSSIRLLLRFKLCK